MSATLIERQFELLQGPLLMFEASGGLRSIDAPLRVADGGLYACQLLEKPTRTEPWTVELSAGIMDSANPYKGWQPFSMSETWGVVAVMHLGTEGHRLVTALFMAAALAGDRVVPSELGAQLNALADTRRSIHHGFAYLWDHLRTGEAL